MQLKRHNVETFLPDTPAWKNPPEVKGVGKGV